MAETETTPRPQPASRAFDLEPGLIHMNHAAVAPWPRRTVEAVAAFAGLNGRRGSLDYPRWLEVEARLRGRLQRLINAASSDEIALLKSTSEGLSVVAYGLDWAAGDNVVITDQEFPSNRIVWESLAGHGVETREAALDAAPSPEEAVMARCDGRTRLVAVSWVQYATGLRMDLARLGAFCRERGILFCVDAIQGLGALRLDVAAAHADFVVADGHKWMLGPEGIALFYCREAVRDRLALRQYGWHMVEHMGDFDRRDWTPAAGGRRFEAGSPNMLGIHGLEASLAVLEEAGMEAVEAAVLDRTRWLLQRAGEHPGVTAVTPVDPDRHAGIVTLRVPGTAPEVLHERLAAAGVFCALRGGGVRLSPHFYTPMAQLETAWDALGL